MLLNVNLGFYKEIIQYLEDINKFPNYTLFYKEPIYKQLALRCKSVEQI